MKNPLPFFRNLLGRAAPLLVVLPGTLMFLLFTFIPMVYCFVGSFAGGKGPLDLYVKFLTSRYFRDLLFTVGVGIATATISFFVSIPAAMMLRGDFRGKSVVQALLLFPMVVP